MANHYPERLLHTLQQICMHKGTHVADNGVQKQIMILKGYCTVCLNLHAYSSNIV